MHNELLLKSSNEFPQFSTWLKLNGTSTGNSEFPAATVAKASVEKGGGFESSATEGVPSVLGGGNIS
jgi:hypothetical protein